MSSPTVPLEMELTERIQEVEDTDLYLELLGLAIETTNNLADAMKIADVAYGQLHPNAPDSEAAADAPAVAMSNFPDNFFDFPLE
jgi:hypothetical protein